MENRRASGLLGRNIFAEAFHQFDEEEFFSNLHHKVKNKPYYDRYLGFKNTVNILSYIFSVASTLTSAYAVYWLASWAGAAVWVSLVIGGVILIFLERIKRKASEETWQVYFFEGKIALGWVSLSIVLFAIGVFSSSFGAKEGAIDFAPVARLIHSDSTADYYRQRIAALESENQRLSRQRNTEGVIYWPAQRQMQRNKETMTKYEARALALDEKLAGTNDNLQAQHDTNVAFASRIFMIVQIVMELFFEACIIYVWYFYYRAYIERKRFKGIQDGSPSPPPPVPNSPHLQQLDPEALAQLIVAALQRMPPAPEPNGQPQEPPVRNSRPIGFYTETQRFQMEHSANGTNPSVQACTDVYREEEPSPDDLYTILHEYCRAGRAYLTPYTENQILARISQYEREVEEAGQKGLGNDITANRSRWLDYWKAKLEELYQKQRQAGLR